MTTRSISRHCQMTPGGHSWAWLPTTALDKILFCGLSLPRLTCSHAHTPPSVFQNQALSCLNACTHGGLCPRSALPPFTCKLLLLWVLFLFFFFALDVSFQRSSHNLSLSISETCFFHRIEHNLIIFVYLEVFFPYVTVNP